MGHWGRKEAKEVAGGVTAPGESMRTEISLVAVPMEMVEVPRTSRSIRSSATGSKRDAKLSVR